MHGHLNVNFSRCTVTWMPIYHDARSPERQIITKHGHLNVNLSRYTVTWTSIYHDARSPERQFITMHSHLNVKFRLKFMYASIWESRNIHIKVFSFCSDNCTLQFIITALYIALKHSCAIAMIYHV